MVLDPAALRGTTTLLTGASGGIGALTARALADAGGTVIAQYRTAPGDLDVHWLRGELGGAEGARALWRAALAEHPRIDVVVANAGVHPYTPLAGTDEEWDAGWEQALQVNVIGTGALLREAARHFIGNGGGTLIVLSSWAAEQGSRLADVTAYAASKAAIRNLAQTLARNHVRDGLRVHVLAPGVVNTGMAVAGQDPAATAAVAEGLAMGRLVDGREVADLVAFLATGACPSLTGATLDINGASYIR